MNIINIIKCTKNIKISITVIIRKKWSVRSSPLSRPFFCNWDKKHVAIASFAGDSQIRNQSENNLETCNIFGRKLNIQNIFVVEDLNIESLMQTFSRKSIGSATKDSLEIYSSMLEADLTELVCLKTINYDICKQEKKLERKKIQNNNT